MADDRGTGMLDQLASYGTVLDAATDAQPVNETPLREIIDLEPVRRPRRVWPLVGVAAAVLLVLVGVVVFMRDSNPDSSQPAGVNHVRSDVDVLARFSLQWAGPWGIAYDGRDVWTGEEAIVTDPDGSSRPVIQVVRRNATTGAPIQTIPVPQESINAIASDGYGAIYVAGGGDGGVPETTVSRIDAASGTVTFTTRLTSPCSCQLAAGLGGVWLGGNGSDHAYRLDGTGKIAAEVALHQRATSLAVVGPLLEVGLVDSRVAVVDPSSSDVVRTIDLVRPGEGPAGGDRPVVAITPVVGPDKGQSWATRVDGTSFLVDAGGIVTRFLRFNPPVDSVARLGDDLYAMFGPAGFDISVRSTVDASRARIRVARRAGELSSGRPGSLVATAHNLWATDADPGRTTIVVRPRRPK